MAKKRAAEDGTYGDNAGTEDTETTTPTAVSQPDLGDQPVAGRWLADCPGQKGIHVKAAEQSDAVALVCDYLGCEPQDVVVSQAKKKSMPKKGDRVLRRGPKPGVVEGGSVNQTGYVYGIDQ